MKRIYLLLLLIFGLILNGGYAQNPSNEEVLKVLAIGNSFSRDAIENYLSELARAEGKRIIIGNMFIGGASLKRHVNSSKEDKGDYQYVKIDETGRKTSTPKTSLHTAITDEDWDYISLQQYSGHSGKLDIIRRDLPTLKNFVQRIASEHTQLVYHQTWAYQQDYDRKAFDNYDKNQKKMYKAITKASKAVSKDKDIAFVIPSGTAIQNGRTSSIGDNFNRDGTHLRKDYGRFTAACTWYEILFHTDVRKNSYSPDGVTPLQSEIAKEAAYRAVKRPFRISKLRF